MSNLKTLDLTGCEKIKVLPDDFETLTSLDELILTKTRLKKLNLITSNIQKLTVNNTSFLTDYFETSYDMPFIKHLNINDTNVRKLHKIIESSKHLKELSCTENGIRFLPDSILELVYLRELNLWSNRISYISPEICRFLISKGIKLSEAFQNNPLVFPSSDVIDQGNEAVLEFLKKREDHAETLLQYRVIFAGEGGSGKSSLVDVLTGRGFDDTKETTKKIRIVTEPFEKEDMTVHFWDFGGQENMHSAHRTFFTDDMLYVIVLDSRKEEKPDEWLRFIGTKTGNKKAIIVLNKIDLNPHYDLDIDRLRFHYPFIIDLFKVSCQSEENIQEFKNTLLTEVKNNYLKPPVENWKSVKKEIFELRESSTRQIFDYEFDKICKKNGISREIRILSVYLHKIGFIFNTLNSRVIVLDTEWLINGIYSIIASEKVISGNGRVQLEDYSDILNGEEQEIYSESEFKDILDLMKDSELCFEEDKGKYILPALLKKETPDSISTKRKILDQLKIYIEYKNYLNSSILYQFIAKMHKSSVEKLYWRTGIYIKGGKNNSAIIESDENLRRISISIHGENKRDFFEKEILPVFSEIHKDYIIQFDILIDIPISDPSRTLEVNYEELKYLETNPDNKKIYPSYQTKKEYYIDRIFENSLSAQKGKPQDLQEELTRLINNKFDELYLHFRLDFQQEQEYEKNVIKWLEVSDISRFEKENRERIINAEFILNLFNKGTVSDYSMYVVQTCRAIEGELKWKFFINTFHKPNYIDIKTELDTKLNELFPIKGFNKDDKVYKDNIQYHRLYFEGNMEGKTYKNKMFEPLIVAFTFYHESIKKIAEFSTIDFFAPYRDFNIQDRKETFIDLLNYIQEKRNKAAHPDYKIRSFSKEEAVEFREKVKKWFSLWISGWPNNTTPQ